MSNQHAITTPDIEFIYEPPPDKEKKVLLLTTGKIATIGKWGDGVGVIGWHPLPKRNKQIEYELENSMEKTLQLAGLIKQWAHDRNIINGSDPKTQALKFVSEAGELARNLHVECEDDIGDCMVVLIVIAAQKGYPFDAVIQVAHNGLAKIPNVPAKDQYLMFMHNVGLMVDKLIKNQDCSLDMAHVLANLISIADRKAYGIDRCLQIAHDDIKDRQGVMYNGTFIKSTDPRYESALAEVKGVNINDYPR